MASTVKKNGTVKPQLGRPKGGALSSYPSELVALVKALRANNEGWGAISILIELEEEYGYSKTELPGEASINRYLKQEGFIKEYVPSSELPDTPLKKAKRVHQLWEMDAQGTTKVGGIGYQAMINIKDSRSKKYCMSFPVEVKTKMSQPSTRHYKWALRLAFSESGMPKGIQVDKDSVFYENTTKSPFPTRFHLWLIALGVDLRFINVRPPAKQAMVERSHQTMEKQVASGKYYKNWKQFFQHCNKRRKRLNEKYPCRTLGKRAPLQAFPKAVHSGRQFTVETEHAALKLSRIYTYLSKGKWYRRVSSVKTISLGGNTYYLKYATPKESTQILFYRKEKLLIFLNFNEHLLDMIPIKGISIPDLMGMNSKNLISTFKKLFYAKKFPLT